jgi:DNA mismatch endonuclease (patch repair protein)
VYAYLRWADGHKTQERYICQVDRATRAENLAQAWAAVDRKNLTVSAPAGSWASSTAVANVMRGNKSRDTKPEKAVRTAVHALGLRYRICRPPVAGLRRTADMVFAGPKVAVFVDGCFWHGCPEHHRPATRNSDFWTEKISSTRQRDRDTDAALAAAGWTVVRVWEHEPSADAARRIESAVLSAGVAIRG